MSFAAILMWTGLALAQRVAEGLPDRRHRVEDRLVDPARRKEVHALSGLAAREHGSAPPVAQGHDDFERALRKTPRVIGAYDEVRKQIDQVRAAFHSRTSQSSNFIHSSERGQANLCRATGVFE